MSRQIRGLHRCSACWESLARTACMNRADLLQSQAPLEEHRDSLTLAGLGEHRGRLGRDDRSGKIPAACACRRRAGRCPFASRLVVHSCWRICMLIPNDSRDGLAASVLVMPLHKYMTHVFHNRLHLHHPHRRIQCTEDWHIGLLVPITATVQMSSNLMTGVSALRDMGS